MMELSKFSTALLGSSIMGKLDMMVVWSKEASDHT